MESLSWVHYRLHMATVSEFLQKIIHMGAHEYSLRISAKKTMSFTFIMVTVNESMQFHMGAL